ncbi:MAG: bifunctional oligoribonuclease/PAP phosphatase NrnA [Halalkalicoccus sp.]|nr:bifunctional oligoribonuclease/PAP phosphatase NrnA [Halalkalicoccus sp.]
MTRGQELLDHLEGVGSLVIVCHNNPDPDCLASALALMAIADESGVDAVRLVASGEISHQENRAFVNLLGVDVEPITEAAVERSELVAFVDQSVPGRHNDLPPETSIDVVIDHHPIDDPVSAAFVDTRPEYGATATILVEYLRELGIEPSSTLASALLFALHRERLDHIRRPTVREYEAARYLFPLSDVEVLAHLYGAAFTMATVDAIGRAIGSRVIRGSVLVACTGRTPERDALPQAADYLLNVEGVDTVLVVGRVGDSICLSARSIDSRIHIGRVLERALDDVGDAGGHQDMAGGHIPLGLLADGDHDTVLDIATDRITERFFEVLHMDTELIEE